jgi:hypothetical protein
MHDVAEATPVNGIGDREATVDEIVGGLFEAARVIEGLVLVTALVMRPSTADAGDRIVAIAELNRQVVVLADPGRPREALMEKIWRHARQRPATPRSCFVPPRGLALPRGIAHTRGGFRGS